MNRIEGGSKRAMHILKERDASARKLLAELDADERIVMCIRKDDMRGLPKVLSRLMTCAKCGEQVWLADSTPWTPESVIWCVPCVQAHAVGDIILEPPTATQVAEIRRVLDDERRS